MKTPYTPEATQNLVYAIVKKAVDDAAEAYIENDYENVKTVIEWMESKYGSIMCEHLDAYYLVGKGVQAQLREEMDMLKYVLAAANEGALNIKLPGKQLNSVPMYQTTMEHVNSLFVQALGDRLAHINRLLDKDVRSYAREAVEACSVAEDLIKLSHRFGDNSKEMKYIKNAVKLIMSKKGENNF